MASRQVRELLSRLSALESGLCSPADLSENDSDEFAEAIMLADELSATLVGGIRRGKALTATALADALVALERLRSDPLRHALTIEKVSQVESLEMYLRRSFGQAFDASR